MKQQLQHRTHRKQRMPNVPAPKCKACEKPMQNVRMGESERVGNSTKVHCLAICSGCGTEHRGERVLDISHGRMKYLSQRFWVDEKAVADRKKLEAEKEIRQEVAAEVVAIKASAKRYLPWVIGGFIAVGGAVAGAIALL